jgi:hypothetical protein
MRRHSMASSDSDDTQESSHEAGFSNPQPVLARMSKLSGQLLWNDDTRSYRTLQTVRIMSRVLSRLRGDRWSLRRTDSPCSENPSISAYSNRQVFLGDGLRHDANELWRTRLSLPESDALELMVERVAFGTGWEMTIQSRWTFHLGCSERIPARGHQQGGVLWVRFSPGRATPTTQ